MTVCSTCNDTHRMLLAGSEVMCTRCPKPCQRCRAGGNGPYCEVTPCPCACHGATDELRSDGAPLYQRWDRCRCKRCKWTGHDGQLGKLRTLMGDGFYPGKCPSCGEERRPLGSDPFERLDGFDVVEAP